MEKHGFKGHSREWWHFTNKDTYTIEETFVPKKSVMTICGLQRIYHLRLEPSTASETLLKYIK